MPLSSRGTWGSDGRVGGNGLRGIFRPAVGVFPWPGGGVGWFEGVALYCPFSSSTTAARFRRYTNSQIRAITIKTATITPIAIPALAPALSPPPPELEHLYDPLNTPLAASRSKSPQDMPEPEMLVSPLTWSMLGRDILPSQFSLMQYPWKWKRHTQSSRQA